jgi:hypothetical protein
MSKVVGLFNSDTFQLILEHLKGDLDVAGRIVTDSKEIGCKGVD